VVLAADDAVVLDDKPVLKEELLLNCSVFKTAFKTSNKRFLKLFTYCIVNIVINSRPSVPLPPGNGFI